MTAVVAPHHADLWHRPTECSIHISDMHYVGMMPSYQPSRTTATTSSLRGFPPTTAQMDLSMPLFSGNVLATSVPYSSSGVFAYDSVNPYNMQQHSVPQNYAMSYPPSMTPPVSFAGTAEVQPLPTVREGQHAFASNMSHMVKSESASPVQSQPTYNDMSYAAECKRSSSEPTEATNINFATDVDTLMKAIQAQQPTSPHRQEAPKVSYHQLRMCRFIY
jgi:hypothetical protein